MDEKLSPGDRLAIVLFCLGAALALILFLIEKSPTTVTLMLLGIFGLMVYPLLHLFKNKFVRIIALTVLLIVVGLLGKSVWPKKATTAETPRTVEPLRTPESSGPIPPQSGVNPTAPSSPTVQHVPKPKLPPRPTQPVTATPTINIGGDVKQGGNGDCQANALNGNATVKDCGNYKPYSTKVHWTPDGLRTTTTGNMTVGFGPFVGSAFTITNKFQADRNWEGLLAWSREQQSLYPDWFTPDLFAGLAQINLCEKSVGLANMRKFIDETNDADEYKSLRDQAISNVESVNSPFYEAQCKELLKQR